jgi:hypothetical protein
MNVMLILLTFTWTCQGLDNYYTMSSKGCTHFWEGQADFSGLEQFERDYFLYTQLMRLRMFRQFKLWKTFKVRQGAVNTSRLNADILHLLQPQVNALHWGLLAATLFSLSRPMCPHVPGRSGGVV